MFPTFYLIFFLRFPIQWDRFQIFASENSENVPFGEKLQQEWNYLSSIFQ